MNPEQPNLFNQDQTQGNIQPAPATDAEVQGVLKQAPNSAKAVLGSAAFTPEQIASSDPPSPIRVDSPSSDRQGRQREVDAADVLRNTSEMRRQKNHHGRARGW
jgi:hypothetical protein